MKSKIKFLLAAIMLLAGTTNARAQIDGSDISVFGGSGTLSSDMTCTYFSVKEQGTLTVEQGVTLTLNCGGPDFEFLTNSVIELHGTMTGSVSNGAMWLNGCYINVYLSDGAKYTVTGLSCSDFDGDSYLRYYGYNAGTDGNGTVSVTADGSTTVTDNTVGYKTTSYTFTATPNSGYRFVNWTKGAGGEVLGTAASIAVTCEQNGQYQVYANFEQVRTLTGVPQGWTVQAGDPLTGVQPDADGSYSIAAGQPVLLTPSAEEKALVKSVTLEEAEVLVNIDGITLDITGCTTWADIIARNPGVIENFNGFVASSEGMLYGGGDMVYTSDTYNPSENYEWLQ